MKLSTKGRYAMVALVDIALQPNDKLVTLGEIAQRQDVSLPYLEQLFVKLRRAELVASVRGPGGGYRLARPASEIRVVDILAAVDETVDAMHKGGRRQWRSFRQPGAIAGQSVVGGAVGACLCLSASDSFVGYHREFAGTLPGGSGIVFGGGRWVSLGALPPSRWDSPRIFRVR